MSVGLHKFQKHSISLTAVTLTINGYFINNSFSESLRVAVELIPKDEVSAAAADEEKSICPHLESL